MTDILIADECMLVREGVAAVLRQEGMRVVGKVANAAALRVALTTARPDVAVLGITSGAAWRHDGLSEIELIKREHRDVGVLVLTRGFDPGLALSLIGRRPASAGYLLKEPLPLAATLVRAVQVVAGGGTFVDSGVIERLRRTSSRCSEPLDSLSEREREILELMAAGRTNNAICAALCLSPKTVESHVRAIFKKLGLRAAPGDHRRVLAVLRYGEARRLREGEVPGGVGAATPAAAAAV